MNRFQVHCLRCGTQFVSDNQYDTICGDCINSTPKTLEQAIENGLCIGELAHIKEHLRMHIHDFLAQKFGVAYMTHTNDKDTLNALVELFAKVTERAKK